MSRAVPHRGGHDVTAGDDLPAGQVAYYPHRTGEYDVTAHGDLGAARARITRIITGPAPGNDTQRPAEQRSLARKIHTDNATFT